METANNRDELARARYDRAVELIAEAEGLLSNGAYKSANNRAFYAAEKANTTLQIWRVVQLQPFCLKLIISLLADTLEDAAVILYGEENRL